MPTLSLRFYLELAASLIIIAGVTAWTMHERKLGRDQIELADAKATEKAQAASKLQTDALAAQAAKAAQEASHAQALLDAYQRQFPPNAWLCNDQNNSRAKLPNGGTTARGPESVRTRPAALPAVPARDISGQLDTLVRSAGRLAALYREYQER